MHPPHKLQNFEFCQSSWRFPDMTENFTFLDLVSSHATASHQHFSCYNEIVLEIFLNRTIAHLVKLCGFVLECCETMEWWSVQRYCSTTRSQQTVDRDLREKNSSESFALTSKEKSPSFFARVESIPFATINIVSCDCICVSTRSLFVNNVECSLYEIWYM